VSPGTGHVRNVLVIMTDQHNPTVGGWLGHPVVQTPHLDALAARGTVFERAHTPAPVCVPARQSLLTGRLPHAHGATGNSRPMRPGERTIAHLAREAGMATGAVGKMHFIGPDQHQGFDTRWDIEDYFAREPDACGDAASGTAAPGCFGKYIPGLVEGSAADGPNPMRIHAGNYDGQPSPLPAERHVEAHVTRQAVRFLEQHRDERWLLWCSYWKPHAPYTPPLEDWERYAALPLPAPDVPEEELAALPEHLRRFRRATGVERLDEDGWRRCMAGYYGCVSFVDREAGTVLAALESLGLRDDTLVIFTSDHGEMMGSHGLLAKSNFYDQSWRIPLIVSHPEHTSTVGSTQSTQALACLTDLFPTIAESAGLPVPENVHGRSLLPVVARAVADAVAGERGEREGVREHVFSELHVRGGAYYGVRDHDWKLARYHDMTQLFDLRADPGERRNVAGEMPEQVERLVGMLEREAQRA
jgi:arylsulfatase A-like enzyme